MQFRHDENKRAKATTQPAPSPEPSTHQDGKTFSESEKVLEAEARLGECLVCRARNILKVLVRIHLVRVAFPRVLVLQEKIPTPPV